MSAKKKKEKVFEFRFLVTILRYALSYRLLLFFAILSTVIIVVVVPLRPYVVEKAIDEYISQNNGQGLVWLVWILFGMILIQSVTQYFQVFLLNNLGQRIVFDIRKKLFQSLINARISFYDKTPNGRIITRVVSDLETVSEIFSQGIFVILGDILKIFGILAVMIYLDPMLTLIVLIPTPLLFLITYFFKEAIKKAYAEVRLRVADLNTFLQEHITGMLIIQSYGVEKKTLRQFTKINNKHKNAHVRSNWYYSVFYPAVELIAAFCTGLLVWYGLKEVLEGRVSFGILVAFIIYISLLFRPIRELADKFNTLQMGLIGGTRVFKLIEENPPIKERGQYESEKLMGAVRFKNVCFAYNKDQPVLKNVSFDIQPREVLAVLGASGAGKSTIVQLINRMYKIDEGTISIDGKNIEDYKLGFLRRRIGIVFQDYFMFSDTIENNICMGDKDISNEDMKYAAKELGAYSFIEKLNTGFDFNIKERGSSLSVGYAQILSMVRAFVYNPDILILDEATSSVDTESEIIIQRAVQKLLQSRTCIVIAHRLSTIKNANKIIVLDKGQVKEWGTHDELILKKSGHYNKIYQAQFKYDKVYNL